MNPYETTPQPNQQKQQTNQTLKIVKRVAFFLIIIIFFVGCTKLQKGIPITNTTTFAEMRKVSLFHGIFVLPMSKLINIVYNITKSTFLAIVGVTIFNRLLGTALTAKSTIEGEKMKEIQPEINVINARYAGRKDQVSMMAKNAEMQKLFSKHNVDPMGSIATTLISLPLFMGIYVAVKDNAYIADKILLGVKTSTKTSVALKTSFNIKIALTIAALVGLQYLAIKVPTWLSNHRSTAKIKTKESDMQRNMAIMLPIMMLIISWQISIALLVYFAVSPAFTILQSMAIHKYIIERDKKKRKKVNELY